MIHCSTVCKLLVSGSNEWSSENHINASVMFLFLSKKPLSSFVKTSRVKVLSSCSEKKLRAENSTLARGWRFAGVLCSRRCLVLLKGNKIQQLHRNSELCGEVKLLFRINSALPPVPPQPFKLRATSNKRFHWKRWDHARGERERLQL